ncbi:YlxQ-related RNA-binding protein [Enterococcus italicus]|uniref:Ribosomal protein L7Ae n=1 Tax=Enterococcus italicus (strain DSM 15952 / CCUG 50447 / LMG 22039 / TP 1.5) TaxID=888064 RepID=E6LGQ5_ENTI1|nr:YlxQ-related RNA-binding protein [Enterococcus italicus]EFU73666.1 ribosomal protein L7Ae [Enterococcus italicus DSM 15952]
MNKQKVLNLLGLATRARKIISGEDLTIQAIRSNKAQVVLLASDAGKNTQKKVKDKCSYYNVPVFDCYTAEELTNAIGKPRMVIGILDKGFASRIEELISG